MSIAARSVVVLLVLAGSGAVDAPGQDAPRREPLIEGTGSYSRRVTTESADAQRYFDQGLNLLFAFNHEAASRAFRQAADLDPGCAMAWWGVAVAQGPHINRPRVEAEPARVAAAAIARARAAAAGASEVERGLIEALATRCVAEPPEDRSGLDRAYADAMIDLAERHPEDPEVAVFAAEALMNLRPWDLYDEAGQPQPGTEAIAGRLERLLETHPEHPMGNHLYIHAVEASNDPGRAAAAADRLRDLQPGLSHNVHMPSHIDVRLGHWAKAAEANRKAIAADRKFLAIHNDPGFYGMYIAHNYHMLAYADMMRGVGGEAIAAIDEMVGSVPEAKLHAMAPILDGYLAMPLEVRMRFGHWDEILEAPEPDAAFPLSRALRLYARGVALAATGRKQEARADRERFREARAAVSPEAQFGNNKARDLLDVAEFLLSGEIMIHEGQIEEGLADLREGVRRQDRLRYSEPPDWIQPVRHALGAALLQAGEFVEAEAVYREDLRQLPNNGWSLYGLARALSGQGKAEEAKAVQARFEEAWKDADIPLSSSCLCLPGV